MLDILFDKMKYTSTGKDTLHHLTNKFTDQYTLKYTTSNKIRNGYLTYALINL